MLNELTTAINERRSEKGTSEFFVRIYFAAFTSDLSFHFHSFVSLTFAGALSASPTHADDDTNQNNYGNKTSDENGNNDVGRM